MKNYRIDTIKNLWSKKIYIIFILSISTFCSVLYYLKKFIDEEQIVFSKSDTARFWIFFIPIGIISIAVMYLIFQNIRLEKKMEDTKILMFEILEKIEKSNVSIEDLSDDIVGQIRSIISCIACNKTDDCEGL